MTLVQSLVRIKTAAPKQLRFELDCETNELVSPSYEFSVREHREFYTGAQTVPTAIGTYQKLAEAITFPDAARGDTKYAVRVLMYRAE